MDKNPTILQSPLLQKTKNRKAMESKQMRNSKRQIAIEYKDDIYDNIVKINKLCM